MIDFVKIGSAQQVKRSGKDHNVLQLYQRSKTLSIQVNDMHAVVLFWPGGFDVNFSSTCENLKQKQG